MAASLDEVVIGRFNELPKETPKDRKKKWYGGDAVFRVGIGESPTERKDAFRVMKNGDVVVNGTLTVTGVVTATGGVKEGGKRQLAEAGAEETILAKIAALEAESSKAKEEASKAKEEASKAKEEASLIKEKLLELDAKVAQLLASGGAA